MTPIILFRSGNDNFEEHYACSKYFQAPTYRTDVRKGDVVIGRYSVLPYYKETYVDLKHQGAVLVNNPIEHNYIAQFHWYFFSVPPITESIPTPKTWMDEDWPWAPECAYVVKGRTNSRKHWWNKQMFANNKLEASIIAGDLMTDSLIGPQGVIYREYVPLKKLGEGLNGLPFVNEWRFFYLGENLVDYGYYWSNSDCIEQASINDDVVRMVNDWAALVSQYINFFVLDVAETESGEWILIEINDGQMSGLSEIPEARFYENLKRVCDDKFPDQDSWRKLLYSGKDTWSDPASSCLC